MSATCAVRDMAKKATTRFWNQALRRTKATLSKQAISPSVSHEASIVEICALARDLPACGWKKSIVSSSFCSMPETQSSPVSNSDSSVTRKEINKLSDESVLTMEVDMEELKALATQTCTPLTLKDMYKYAVDFNDQEQRLRNAQFLHKELPIRLAQRAVDLLTLPHGLSDAVKIRRVTHVYLRYLEMFQECPVPTTPAEEEEFTDMLQSMVLDRTSIPMAVAQGVASWIENDRREDMELEHLQEMEEALYRFFTARVGLRFLTEHHILSSPSRVERKELRKAQSSVNEEEEYFLGCIQTDCCPGREVRKVAAEVSRQTNEYYGVCPEIQIVDSTRKNTKFTYVPHHLHYMLGEVLKNSCRATVEKYLEDKKKDGNEIAELEPIRVVIVKGEEDVTIKVCDRGGGIPRSKVSKIWKFAHSTAAEDENLSDFGVDAVAGTKIRGFGLPLARIYARYLGGELTLKSMEGYGLDAYLHLPRLGDSCEHLPPSVRKSPSNLDSMPVRKEIDKFGKGTRGFSTVARRDLITGSYHEDETLDEKTRRILNILKERAL